MNPEPKDPKARDSELIYIEADKYIEEVKGYQESSFYCNRRFRYSAKKAFKRRIAWGPDAVCLIHSLTREFIK